MVRLTVKTIVSCSPTAWLQEQDSSVVRPGSGTWSQRLGLPETIQS